MSSSAIDMEAPDLVCQLANVHGMVDALSAVRWKRHQDAVIELSEHGIVLILEESGCLQAKVYLQKELFICYDYGAQGRPRFGVSLGLFVDCLNTFSVPGNSSTIEIRYPGPDMQLLLKSVDSLDSCIYAEIRTRIPETVSWDYDFEPAGSTPLSFTVKVTGALKSTCTVDPMNAIKMEIPKEDGEVLSAMNRQFLDSCYVVYDIMSAALKEAIDDLEWPGSSIQITLQPDPPSVTFKGEGHGDLQIDFMYYVNTDLLTAFHCDRQVSHRYKYKFLRAVTANLPSSMMKDNRGSKVTIGRGGMLKVQHLVSVARPSSSGSHINSGGHQQPGRIAYIEFYVKPEADTDDS